jgi:hypothetical protein
VVNLPTLWRADEHQGLETLGVKVSLGPANVDPSPFANRYVRMIETGKSIEVFERNLYRGQTGYSSRNLHCLVGNFRRQPAKIQRRFTDPTPESPVVRASAVGAALALSLNGITMSRLSVLAIVLTLGLGPDASILCRAWCTDDNLSRECHPKLTATIVVDCCDSPSPNMTAVPSGELRQQVVSPSQVAGAILHHVRAPAASARLLHRTELRVLHANSLAIVLRI